MKKGILVLLTLLFLSTVVIAHPGRTDKNGGHNCTQKSKDKGLCTEYHKH